MPVVDAALGYYKSSRANSDGGTITAVKVESTANSLFADVTPTQASTGVTTYRKIFVKNEVGGDTVTGVHIWKTSDTSSRSDEIYIGIGTTSDTTGSAVTYYDPHSYAEGVNLGNIAPGASVGVWLKRVVIPGMPYNKDNYCTIKCQGEDF